MNHCSWGSHCCWLLCLLLHQHQHLNISIIIAVVGSEVAVLVGQAVVIGTLASIGTTAVEAEVNGGDWWLVVVRPRFHFYCEPPFLLSGRLVNGCWCKKQATTENWDHGWQEWASSNNVTTTASNGLWVWAPIALTMRTANWRVAAEHLSPNRMRLNGKRIPSAPLRLGRGEPPLLLSAQHATTRRLRMQNGWQWEVRGVRCDSPIATENGLGSEPMVVKMMPTRTNNKQSWVVLIWCGINPLALAARIWCVTITSSNATTNGCYWALTASQNDDDGESSLHWEELDLLELRECGEESPLHQLLSSVVEGFNIMCPNCHCFMLLPVADSSYSYYSCSTWSPSTHPSPNTLLVCCMLGAGGSSLFSSHCSPHGSA